VLIGLGKDRPADSFITGVAAATVGVSRDNTFHDPQTSPRPLWDYKEEDSSELSVIIMSH
jgi:hypothetical protein